MAACRARGRHSANFGGTRPSPGRRRDQTRNVIQAAPRHLQGQRAAGGTQWCAVGEDSGHDLREARRMIAVDTNILVYAQREDSPFHELAFRRVTELAESPATW